MNKWSHIQYFLRVQHQFDTKLVIIYLPNNYPYNIHLKLLLELYNLILMYTIQY